MVVPECYLQYNCVSKLNQVNSSLARLWLLDGPVVSPGAVWA